MLKRCGKCGERRPVSDFHRRREGHQPWCKQCKSEYAAEYYRRHRVARLEYNRRQRVLYTERYHGLKEGRPCADCGGLFPPVSMQWDHPPGVTKEAHVADLRLVSQARLLDEIQKCELVCANCHAVRTFRRGREVDVA
jgi:hypothetical protein